MPPKRLVLTWADPADETDVSRVTFEIEPIDDMVRLDVIHGDFRFAVQKQIVHDLFGIIGLRARLSEPKSESSHK